MNKFSSDKIAVCGLVVALIISILAGIWTGNGVELQTTIASGLVGYIGRVIQEEHRKEP
jgi:hypothetical protein